MPKTVLQYVSVCSPNPHEHNGVASTSILFTKLVVPYSGTNIMLSPFQSSCRMSLFVFDPLKSEHFSKLLKFTNHGFIFQCQWYGEWFTSACCQGNMHVFKTFTFIGLLVFCQRFKCCFISLQSFKQKQRWCVINMIRDLCLCCEREEDKFL